MTNLQTVGEFEKLISRTVVPACPGLYIVDVVEQSNEDGSANPYLEKTPIVAWIITIIRKWENSKYSNEHIEAFYTLTEPVSVDDAHSDAQYILYPTGRIIDPFNADWENEEAFIKSRWEELKKDIEKRKGKRKEK